MNCEKAVTAYLDTLKEGFACAAQPNGRLCVVTPYLYPDHDNIEVFVRSKDSLVFVSDLGETLRYLDTNGMDIMATPNLLFAARRIADGFGVEIREGVLVKNGPTEAVGQLLFDVVSAVKAVASLLYSNRAYEPRVFDDEVAEFFEVNDLRVERRMRATGQTGKKYRVSMVVWGRKSNAWIETVSSATVSGIPYRVNATFRLWSDINGSLAGKKVSLLNDGATFFKQEDIALLENVSKVYRWTNSESLLSAIQTGAVSES
jgi:hypothetical protein